MLLRVECGIMRETLVLMETGGEGKTHETYGGRKFIPSNPRGVHVARQVHAPCVEKSPSRGSSTTHDIPEHEKQSDYVKLLNMVQRHTCCSTSYCLRKKSNETELKCRFHFPFDICPKTRLEFKKIHTSGDNEHYRAKIVTRQNDSTLNNHQQLQLQGWRANCDIQVVIDHYACVEYLTKYAAKCEPRSPILKQALSSIVQNVDSDTDPRRAIEKVVMKSLGERDYAAQETMHHLLSLKLHSSSFKVMPVSLNGSRRVRDTASIDEGESCTNYSLPDVYANCELYESSENIMNMNFVPFATTYKVVNNELTKLLEGRSV